LLVRQAQKLVGFLAAVLKEVRARVPRQRWMNWLASLALRLQERPMARARSLAWAAPGAVALQPASRQRVRRAERLRLRALVQLAEQPAASQPLGLPVVWRRLPEFVAAAVLSLLKPDGVEGKSCAERA